MTERDAFEARFHAAIRGYVERVSSDLDAAALARRIASAEPRRRGLAGALAWRRLPVPQRAWTLLLLAGLVAAMVGGLLVVGSQPARKLPAVTPPFGPAYVCPPGTNPDTPGPAGQARPPEPLTLFPAFDRRAGKLVFLATSPHLPVPETWTFDVCTNTWTQMHPIRDPDNWENRLVYDVDSDVTIEVDGKGVWAYDLAANTWTKKNPGGTLVQKPLTRADFYDPVSGLVVALRRVPPDDLELSTYDVETDTWAAIRQANRLVLGTRGFWLVYDASVDRVIAYTYPGAETWLFDLRTGTWARSGAVTPEVYLNVITAYDEAAERTVVFGHGPLSAYDAAADRWELLTEDLVTQHGWQFPSAYDPVNGRFVGFSDYNPGDGTPDGLVALDPLTREVTVLLEPGPAQPAP